MDILVLGGTGYLGSKVVRRLIGNGHRVICTRRETSDLKRLRDLESVVAWIPSSCDAIASVSKGGIDLVINTACDYGREDDSMWRVFDANMVFPLKALDKAAETGTTHFLTIGTGLPDRFNFYSFSKCSFGDIGKFYAEKLGIDFYDLNLEMFYGPDEPSGRFLSSVVRKMLQGERVDMTAGTQKRDIIAVGDVVDAILLVMGSGLRGYQRIPVGTGQAPAIREIVDFIWQETEKRSEVSVGSVPMRKDEPDCVADTSVLKSIGDWHPLYWKEGLRQMIDTIRRDQGVIEKQGVI